MINEAKLLYTIGGYFNPLDDFYTPFCIPKPVFNTSCSFGGGLVGGGGAYSGAKFGGAAYLIGRFWPGN